MKLGDLETLDNRSLDLFLKEKIKYGYWQFAHSMVWVYFFYQEKRYKIVKRDFRKKIEDLSKLKQKTIENIDALLMKINFYENSKIALYEPDKEFVWTSEKKEDFILKTFKLTEFSEISKSYKEYLEKDDKRDIYADYRLGKTRLKPVNLIILIWSFACKRGERIEWKLIFELLRWFNRKIKEIEANKYFEIEDESITSTERLRFLYNKYRKTDNIRIAEIIYRVCFFDKYSKEYKQQTVNFSGNKNVTYRDPIAWLDEWLWGDKQPEGWIAFNEYGLTLKILENTSEYLDRKG